MPQPIDLRLFSRTADIDSPVGSQLMLKEEQDDFAKYHYSPSNKLNDDALHGSYFSMFGLRIYVWGITRYAGGTQNFDIIGAQSSKKLKPSGVKISRLTPTSAGIKAKFFKNKNCSDNNASSTDKTGTLSNRGCKIAESTIIKEFATGQSNLANSLELYLNANNLDAQYLVEMLSPLVQSYGCVEMNDYKKAMVGAATQLPYFQPLIRIGAAYMQIKRAGELSKEIEENWQIIQLMGALQQAAFDIVSYNIGASLFYAQARRLQKKDLPDCISDIFGCHIDSVFEVSNEDILSALAQLEEIFGKNSLGDFLKNIKEEVSTNRKSFNEVLNSVLARYQTALEYKPITDNEKKYERYGSGREVLMSVAKIG